MSHQRWVGCHAPFLCSATSFSPSACLPGAAHGTRTTASPPHGKTFGVFSWLFLTQINSLISFSMWPWRGGGAWGEAVVPKQTVQDGNEWLKVRTAEPPSSQGGGGLHPERCSYPGTYTDVNAFGSLGRLRANQGLQHSADEGWCRRMVEVFQSSPPGGSEITNGPSVAALA